MERAEYLAKVQEEPWTFPSVTGCPDPPPEWVAAAWDAEAVQGTIAADMARDVSKCGGEFSTLEFLERLSAALDTEQVVRLFHLIRNESPHRELEFRPLFEQGFARHAAALPAPLTRQAVVAAFGDDETAAELMGWEPQEREGAPIGYSFRLVRPEAFAGGCPEDQGGAEGGAWFTIHRGADYALHRVFDQLGGPLRFALAGDLCPHGDYDRLPATAPEFSAWVTPQTVRQVAAALAKLPRWRVIELLRALDRRLVQYKEGRDLYSGACEAVQAAYAAAAEGGAGLRILIR